MHRSGEIWMAVILGIIFLGFLGYWTTQRIVGGPNRHYYQRTKTDNRGTIARGHYSQAELEALTRLTHGSQYHGNTSLDIVATKYVYQLDGKPLPNIVGNDGVLQLYNKSKFMTTAMVRDAAAYWNHLAGAKIVAVVDSQRLSDEVIHDNETQRGVLGRQSYNGQGLVFFPPNWHMSGLSAKDRNNWQEAALIHEIGHALGIPHLGGGPLGGNAASAGILTAEFMAPWRPGRNPLGVRSTAADAAALALAGLSWQQPRRLASWVLTDPAATVIYNQGRLTSTIPRGSES
ncbi:hypothetical protein [Levilactobacillus parabrevis]|uniref:hypothetical protein n=1 Tax=Levilactobacillus parabrevis TaxID=357278 RepID=UPI0021A633EF|nr:hypothetical protein [Levilactobacillus parabrevis]MCT4488178.1 hypothetical protein [Levilactobacillus parabrevis]MCT4490998.1 hypothetical protein [Levilactobacillus parabrevis]